jgi:hypothetical protein
MLAIQSVDLVEVVVVSDGRVYARLSHAANHHFLVEARADEPDESCIRLEIKDMKNREIFRTTIDATAAKEMGDSLLKAADELRAYKGQ